MKPFLLKTDGHTFLVLEVINYGTVQILKLEISVSTFTNIKKISKGYGWSVTTAFFHRKVLDSENVQTAEETVQDLHK